MQQISESDADAEGAVEVDMAAITGFAAKSAAAAQERAAMEPEELETVPH